MTNLNSKRHESTEKKLEREQLRQSLTDLKRDSIEPDDYLNERAIRTFQFFKENLDDQLANVDSYALSALAVQYAEYAELSEMISGQGLIVEGEANPLLRTKRQALEGFIKLYNELGLSPKARISNGLKAIKQGAVSDPFAELIENKRTPSIG